MKKMKEQVKESKGQINGTENGLKVMSEQVNEIKKEITQELGAQIDGVEEMGIPQHQDGSLDQKLETRATEQELA